MDDIDSSADAIKHSVVSSSHNTEPFHSPFNPPSFEFQSAKEDNTLPLGENLGILETHEWCKPTTMLSFPNSTLDVPTTSFTGSSSARRRRVQELGSIKFVHTDDRKATVEKFLPQQHSAPDLKPPPQYSMAYQLAATCGILECLSSAVKFHFLSRPPFDRNATARNSAPPLISSHSIAAALHNKTPTQASPRTTRHPPSASNQSGKRH